MYVNPFWAGVAATILLEVVFTFLICIYIAWRSGKK